MQTLEVKYLSVDELLPYDKNSRTHSDSQILQIEKSIKEFGFTNPLLITENNEIIAGHGRLSAAKNLGLDAIPTIVLSNLTETQQRAYVIADNQLALNSGWDISLLSEELTMLDEVGLDISLLGFDDNEIAELMGISPYFEPATEKEQGKLDELDPKWIDCPHCGKEFDLRKHG
jgi:ParB-like chromosome segregation protein Spo0J